MGKTLSTYRVVFLLCFVSVVVVLVGDGEHAMVSMWRSEDNFEKLVLFFHHVCSEEMNFGCEAWW